MIDPGVFLLRASWGGRSETVAEIARRLAATLELFARAGGLLSLPWFEFLQKKHLDPSTSDIAQLVAAGVSRDPDGTSYPQSGYTIALRTGDSSDGRASQALEAPRVMIRVSAGNAFGSERRAVNSFLVKFEGDYPVLEELMPNAVNLVSELAAIWDVEFADLDSFAMITGCSPRAERQPMVGFVTWLSDRVSGDLSGVPVHHQERCGAGTLLSVDLDGGALVEDATALWTYLVENELLLPIPVNQYAEPEE